MLSLDMIAEVFAGEDAWVVGGAVRDDLLGRTALDIDVACRDPERAARALVARAGDAVFPLNEEFGAWRVVLDRSKTVDFSPLRGGSIDADLGARDFTANAIAQPVAGGEYVDPLGGRGDVESRTLRTVSIEVFDHDPL
jgi:tRNA nucleotidyltransferase/poly(A) polymerase